MNNRALILLLSLLAAAVPAHAHDGVVHGNTPQHGGVVQSSGPLHFEIVLLPQGGVQVYFSDAGRKDIPAGAVSHLKVEVEQPGRRTEAINMAISPNGDFWGGRSRPVVDPRSIVRLAFVAKGRPELIELPGSFWPRLGKRAGGREVHRGH